MSARLEKLKSALREVLGDKLGETAINHGEVVAVVAAEHYLEVARQLRDRPELDFAQLMDLSGIDYSLYTGWHGKRFAVSLQLLSLTHNWRICLRVFVADESLPRLPSVTTLWNGANWYERETFDFFGILFEDHPDLRRILTDYGFVGHPFRKDFPVYGHVEMRYDAEQRRVVYQPVTIEPREVTPRIVREENYGRAVE